jgi:hypothetical protein
LTNTPYDKDFIDGAMCLGGRWYPPLKAWVFPAQKADAVLLLEFLQTGRVYGAFGEVWEANLDKAHFVRYADRCSTAQDFVDALRLLIR